MNDTFITSKYIEDSENKNNIQLESIQESGQSPNKLLEYWKRGKTSSSVRRPWMIADRGTSNDSTIYSKGVIMNSTNIKI